MKNKTRKNEVSKQNRENYMSSKQGDLRTYASFIGDNFYTKVNLLAQLIQDNHYPSLGRYKERLLAKTISDFIPKSYEVGTGFVLFPTKNTAILPSELEFFNASNFVPSRQCDILVYDPNIAPVLFRDDDLVVIRPESVRAVVEVKGTLDNKQTSDAIKNIIDFGRKWRNTQNFYKNSYAPVISHNPCLLIMGWQSAINSAGYSLMNGKLLRKKIVGLYSSSVKPGEIKDFPILKSAYIYQECEVSSSILLPEDDNDEIAFGWSTYDGKFLIKDKSSGQLKAEGDRTISDLLQKIQSSLPYPRNSFFSTHNDGYKMWLDDFKYKGRSIWLKGEREIGEISGN